MSETPIDMGMTSASPSGSASPAPAPSQQQEGHYRQQQQHPAQNPRAEGYSPAQQARQQQPSAGERMLTIGGMERPEQEVLDILASHAERQVAQAALPKDPNGYQIKLPEGFKPPEGMQWEFKTDDPALKTFREIAHRRGLDQETFSEALGAFASVKLAEHQMASGARQREMDKLGAVGQQRIEAVETWLKAKVGDKACTIISTLK